MRIGMFADGFIGWGGGIDFLKTYINILKQQDDKEIILFLPYYKGVATSIKNILRPIKRTLCYFIKIHKFKFVGNDKNPLPELEENFLSEFPDLKIIEYNAETLKSHKKAVIENKIDVIFPTLIMLGKNFPVPWIIYLPDLQHKYYPHFFSKFECLSRDKKFLDILTKAPNVIVESEDVVNDFKKFYPQATARVFATPFYAIPRPEWLCRKNIDISGYKLPKRYFLISNQFWIHKNHITAFKALAELHKNSEFKDVGIVCTGKMNDYRAPGLLQDLQNQIKKLGIENSVLLLGYIPKLDQVEILCNAVALIQPTLFEGNPGGISVCEALSLGKRAIVSDIAVNKELLNYPEKDLATFFNATSPEDLANKMIDTLNQKSPNFSKKQLEDRGKNSLNLVGRFVDAMLNKATQSTPPHHHTPQQDKLNCCICGSDMNYWDSAPILDKYNANYFICENCGFIQTEKPYWLEESYSSAITDLDIGLVSRNIQNSNRVTLILKFLFRHRKISCIDYGGGYGMFTRIMRDNGYDFSWYDKYCENLFAKNHNADIKKHYNILTAFELMEHIYNPEEQLKEFCNIADTIIFSTSLVPKPTPKVKDWWYFVPEEGQHISFYTKKSLEILSKKLNRHFISSGDLHIISTRSFNSFGIKTILFFYKIFAKFNEIFIHRNSLLQEDFNKLRTV